MRLELGRLISIASFALSAVTCCCAAHASTTTGDIPFELVRNSVVAQVSLEGHQPCAVLIDTGADPSIIDLKVAREIGLRLSGAGIQGEGGGTDINKGYPTSVHDLKLGDLEIGPVNAIALDLSAPSRGLGQDLCGVIGYDVLKKHVVQFDYANHVVRFLDRATPPGNDTIVLRSRYSHDLLVQGLKVHGHRVIANFDTGSNSAFQLTDKAARRLFLQASLAPALPSQSTGFNGATENLVGSVDEISVGPTVFHNPKVVFYGAHTGRDNVEWDLRVGNGFFKEYRVTFDFKKGIVTLDQGQGHAQTAQPSLADSPRR